MNETVERIADPVERAMAAVLRSVGVPFKTDGYGGRHGLDFDCGDVFIEVKAMHSDRIAEQMSRAKNVIAVQGMESVKFLADILTAERQRAEKAEQERDELAAEVAALRDILERYRKETPIGHQPHMIAQEADAALSTPPSQHLADLVARVKVEATMQALADEGQKLGLYDAAALRALDRGK